ncbi:HNH endonuclease [Shewanella algae]|uniref:HNH endonuclease n=1 Tax=Shewanella algae TaxID=38313 RepID=UPI001AAD95FF|nr:HNH endonuclease [Shewanella algae]QTE81710.1 HNH endonuclease [Shewanella algae]
MSNEQLVSLAPSGRSLEQLKRELADGSRVILSDTPILPLFRYQSGEWVTNIQEGISPHAVNQIQKRFASAGSSAHFKTSTGSLAPAIEPVYSPDPSLTQIAPTTAPTAKISPKFAQARRRLELELVYDDKEETAAGKVPYRVEFSDGSQKSGVLNAKGWACLEDCPNGEATVIFGDEAERQSAEQRLPGLYRQLAASLDTAAAEMAKKSEQLAAQADVQQISDSFRQKVDAQLAELTAQREQFNQQQIWQQALQTGQAYTQGLSQGAASFMDDLLDFSGLMAFLEEAEISLSLLLEAIMTGDVDALEAKLAQWRARGENGLKATGEAMEMLILLLKDEYVRALLQSLPLRYLDALPKDKLAEITGYIHSRVSLDGMLEMSLVLLAALVGSVFGVILMFLVVTKKRASRIISPASSVLEDIAKAQKAIRNDHAVQTYIGKHQTPLNSKAPEGDVDTPLKSQENAGGDVPNKYTHSAPYSGNPLESSFVGPRDPAAIPENPSAYSVAYEMKLEPADFGKSRSVHFNRANASLDNALQSDIEFLNMMDELIPGVQSSVSSVGGRATPSGWTWEHASTSTAFGEEGVMRLVPSSQHTPGSPFWRILHPDAGASGGYSEWATPNGAPKN